MMSVSAVGRCASIVSFAPPPVAPTRSRPPVFSLPPLSAGVPPPPPPPPPLSSPPHAPSTPPAPRTTAPPRAPRSTCRRVTGSSSHSSLGSVVTPRSLSPLPAGPRSPPGTLIYVRGIPTAPATGFLAADRNNHQQREPEDRSHGRQERHQLGVGRFELSARDRGVDLALAPVAVGDERHAEQREPDPDQGVRPAVLLCQRGNQLARAEADRERGQARAPPREVRALVGETRAPGRVAGLVEAAASGRRLIAHGVSVARNAAAKSWPQTTSAPGDPGRCENNSNY